VTGGRREEASADPLRDVVDHPGDDRKPGEEPLHEAAPQVEQVDGRYHADHVGGHL
jgi:hypothetical protein